MDAKATQSSPPTAQIVVVGNEKGGSGKTTTAMHLVVALMQGGLKVATIDLDSRQQSLTRYVENRKAWAARNDLVLPVPTHFRITRSETLRVDDNETREFALYAEALAAVEQTHDVIVIDTPATDSYLMRLAHSMADAIVTPINDSFIDLDVLARLDPDTQAVLGPSHFGEMVADARRMRELVSGHKPDWIVTRNRMSSLSSRNQRHVGSILAGIAGTFDFRLADGIGERTVFREFFPRGLTALDALDEQTLGAKPALSHLAARQEVRALAELVRQALRLPALPGRPPEPVIASRASLVPLDHDLPT
jgi:chromosome partitioning protein